ncbi:hypothetical protein OH76DRAFT_1400514 [Lentinus brumalis]|uniref:Uncharacterized protein n=1 Tax=Lentinus brumalis TaxID=2498619 RepID=A0A371DI31_9APHY|nr:hypothetical protein OH76DRAFT_1400514 [Polyporus brumalis]
MTDHGASVVKREKTAESIPNSLPAPQFFSRLPLAVLDAITGAFDSPERKTSICTPLAWALTCRAALRPAQTRLYK